MKDNLWRQLEPMADQAYEEIERFLTSPQANELRTIIQKAAAALPEGYSTSLDISLNVFDPERDNALPLMTTGLAASGPGEPYVAHGDSTPGRYTVDGEICEVPHDRCPHCWGTWDFKIGHPVAIAAICSCPHCGYELGKELKLMLDDDKCPHCEKGELSMDDPTCSKCGLEIDPSLIAWG